MAEQRFEEHKHDPLVHEHDHWHVTHNWTEAAGTFEHLAAQHAHEHDHAALAHSHVPHQDFESEHAGEAHVHDHDKPIDEAREGMEQEL
ncbi:MAG: hypothetical protein ACRDYA_19700 [Egibacteraceae bacterium]